MNVQAASETYTATPCYQQPVVSALPLDVTSDERERHPTESPAAESQSVPTDVRQQPQGDREETQHDDYYSELDNETGLPPPSPPVTMTSSSHVTEMLDTPVKLVLGADATVAVYSALDEETRSERDVMSSPSVYEALADHTSDGASDSNC